MFIHIFGFRWKAEATEADQARATKEILAFRGAIPGLIEVHVGPNVSPRGQGYMFAGLMKFTDKAAADAYSTHPAHLALLVWLVPLIEPVELDFEAIED
jgi:Stress responsive A/B Barrel Domain